MGRFVLSLRTSYLNMVVLTEIECTFLIIRVLLKRIGHTEQEFAEISHTMSHRRSHAKCHVEIDHSFEMWFRAAEVTIGTT